MSNCTNCLIALVLSKKKFLLLFRVFSSLPFTLFYLPWVQIIIKNFYKFFLEVGRISFKYIFMLYKKKLWLILVLPIRGWNRAVIWSKLFLAYWWTACKRPLGRAFYLLNKVWNYSRNPWSRGGACQVCVCHGGSLKPSLLLPSLKSCPSHADYLFFHLHSSLWFGHFLEPLRPLFLALTRKMD